MSLTKAKPARPTHTPCAGGCAPFIAPLSLAISGIIAALALTMATDPAAFAQTAANAPDTALTQAETLAGKALILRNFYTANDLNYDVEGRVQGTPKTEDWTLAGVNILKAERRKPTEIELDGLRVAIRYNQDAHQFERHPQKDEPIKIIIATSAGPAEAQTFDRALAAIFSIGIDPALQRSTPEFWRHYFDPSLAWPKDALTDMTIVTPGSSAPGSPTPEQMKTFINPVVEHNEKPKFTDLAIRDKLSGEIELRMVVDAEGVPRRISILRPMGYGLDARAIETVAKWRFHPGTLEGKPVPSTIIVRENFEVAPPLR